MMPPVFPVVVCGPDPPEVRLSYIHYVVKKNLLM